jgi:hypothetical protein
MLKETKTTTQSKIPFLWLQSRLPIHKRESRKKAGLLGCSEASESSRTGVCFNKAFFVYGSRALRQAQYKLSP